MGILDEIRTNVHDAINGGWPENGWGTLALLTFAGLFVSWTIAVVGKVTSDNRARRQRRRR